MRIDQRYRFDNLVVGPANRLAVAAARAVAEKPGTVYNPLFIYGASGLGKTHVLGAIGEQVLRLHPEVRVEYATLAEFVEQFHAAVAAGTTDAWAARWQRVNVLLVDDTQFLTGRRETQSELLRLFTSMQQGGRQLVLTSDRPPSEIADVDERLIARLAGGLVVDIGKPEFETRAAILRAAATERGFDAPDTLLNELARLEFANVRELNGALNRLIAHTALGRGETRVEDIARALGIATPTSNPRPSVHDFHSYLAGEAPVAEPETDNWQGRLSGSIAYWTAEGYRTTVLSRALAASDSRDVDKKIEAFKQTVERLRTLERQAASVDPALASNEIFRDPEQAATAADLVKRALAGHIPPPGPLPVFTRALYEVSTSNRLAAKAGDAVAERPGQRYNPLFIHGPSGVGKTHLAHAIGNDIVARSGGGLQVACVTAQRFADELIAAIGSGFVERWRARYRAADVLILDDVQLLAGKERTQEELFHVFNALFTAGKQLVFTSDTQPRKIQGLEERLQSRFEGGLVAPIDPPDRALRARIAIRTLLQRGVPPDGDLVQVVADQPLPSAREIVAVVHRLVAASEGRSVALTADFARAELRPAARATPSRVPIRAADPAFLDVEKVVWEWPDPSARFLEELR